MDRPVLPWLVPVAAPLTFLLVGLRLSARGREPSFREGAVWSAGWLVLSLLAAVVGKKIFNFVWTKIDDEEPPKATTEEAPWSKIITAAAVQGVIFKVTRVVVDRYGARGWSYLTGTWPGKKRPDPDE